MEAKIVIRFESADQVVKQFLKEEWVSANIAQFGRDISEEMNFQSMAYDFIFNGKMEPEIAEISSTYVDTAIYKCSF